jgi:hypothetical protein
VLVEGFRLIKKTKRGEKRGKNEKIMNEREREKEKRTKKKGAHIFSLISSTV